MFAQVVALVPDSYRGYSNLGGVYLLQQKDMQAREAFEKSLSLRPNYTAASNLGTLYFYQGEYERAATVFKEALNIQATDYIVWGNLAAVQKNLNLPEAQESYRRAAELAEARLRLNPRDATAMVDLARYRGSLNEKTVAEELVAKALKTRTDDARLLLSAAGTYEIALANREQALKYLQRAFELGLALRDVERSVALKELRADPRFKEIEKTAINK
jgi:Tfp pilus assembly protein PilF